MNPKKCIEKLKLKDKGIYEKYQSFVGKKKKGFYSLKMVGEHQALKKIFVDTLLEHGSLVETQRFIKKNKDASFTLLLKQLNKEIIMQGYTGLLILIDELGKTIEYSSEKYLESDIHVLQDLAEYVNKQSNMRLVVALHKSFKGYVHNSTYLSFTEWDKIQGRFDSIIFQDDFYELMHIFEQSIHVNDPQLMFKITDKIASVYDEYKNIFKNKEISIEATSLTKLAPLHPFSSLALFHIFSKYFQNQRSVFSFLSAQEPHSFQDFIKHEINQNTLYTLDYLFDYINYLSNAYAVNMIDKESWILANEYIDSTNRLSNVEIKIIKAVALISAFGLEHLIQLDAQALALAFCSIKNIHEEIRELFTTPIV